MKEIILFKENGQWLSRHLINGEPSKRLMEAFSTHILPTPFNDKTSSEDVLEAISKLNKDCFVSIAKPLTWESVDV